MNLIERLPLHQIVSATVYREVRKQPRVAGNGTLVAFADPALPSHAADRAQTIRLAEVERSGLELAPLPETRREVNTIATLFPTRSTTYIGREATESRFKSVAPNASLLHVASHGYLDREFPLDSGLVMTPSPGGGEGDNGLLQAWEVFEQVQLNTDLVTLSACETGLGEVLQGEGLIGLTRAFQYAGARSILASLWRVSDQSTAELMEHFYVGLAKGVPKDAALRNAQLALLRGTKIAPQDSALRGVGGLVESTHVKHPFYWAAFELIGDWQ